MGVWCQMPLGVGSHLQGSGFSARETLDRLVLGVDVSKTVKSLVIASRFFDRLPTLSNLRLPFSRT